MTHSFRLFSNDIKTKFVWQYSTRWAWIFLPISQFLFTTFPSILELEIDIERMEFSPEIKYFYRRRRRILKHSENKWRAKNEISKENKFITRALDIIIYRDGEQFQFNYLEMPIYLWFFRLLGQKKSI